MRVLPFLVRRSLRTHALSTIVTGLSAALAAGLAMAVFAVHDQAQRAFRGGAGEVEAVLGARGSELQLVLNAVFHLETSPGNVPWSLYEELRADPRVTAAVPYAVGDNYRGFRIVGTTRERFQAFGPMPLETGRLFDPGRAEAVLGSFVAQRTGLGYGDAFHPAHGVSTGGDEHADRYVVTGVLAPTNSPADRAIWIPIEGVFRMDGHVLHGAGEEFEPEYEQPIPEEHKEVSAVLLKLASPAAGFQLKQEIARGKDATLAWPVAAVVADLFGKLGWAHRVLALVALLVVFVAAAGILASLYNTMKERRRELAILRALGARRATVFGVLVLESTAIATAGALAGYLAYFAVLLVAGAAIRAETGVVLDVLAFHPALVWTPPAMALLGALAGLLPAAEAYRTEVAQNLV